MQLDIIGIDGKPLKGKSNELPFEVTSSKRKPEFYEKIILAVIDKLFIGLVIISVGIWANSLLERQKTESAFSNELNIIKAKKTGEVWEYIYFLESELIQNIRDGGAILKKSFREKQSNLEMLQKAMEKRFKDVEKKYGKNITPEERKKIPEIVSLEKEYLEYQEKTQNERIKIRVQEQELYSGLFVQAYRAINKNKFWLGQEQYQLAISHIDLLKSFSREDHNSIVSFSTPSVDGIKNLEKESVERLDKLERQRQFMDTTLRKILSDQ